MPVGSGYDVLGKLAEQAQKLHEAVDRWARWRVGQCDVDDLSEEERALLALACVDKRRDTWCAHSARSIDRATGDEFCDDCGKVNPR